MWTGSFLKSVSLFSLDFIFNLGHDGVRCPEANPQKQPLVIVDLTGVHVVRVTWCNCMEGTSLRNQLLRVGWFPATIERPSTAMTFDALKFFHKLTFQAKTSFYDFYRTICRFTDDSGTEYIQVSAVSPFSLNPISHYGSNFEGLLSRIIEVFC